MLNAREKELSESVEEESTAPEAAVMMDRPEEKQEEMSLNNYLEGTETARNVVICSDSMAKYTQQYLSCHEFNYHVVAHRGAQIHDVTQNIREFSAIDKSTIAAVVLHVGTNNLCNSQTVDQNVQDYKDLVRVAVDSIPNAGILVSGILPRFDSEDLNNAVRMYNIVLAQLCATFTDKVKFVDLGSHFRSDHFFAMDGLHLSYQGNPRFAAKLQEAVEYHFSTDPEHIRWKEAFSAAMLKVPFPKPSLLGPRSAAKVKQTLQREIKPKLPRRCFKSVKGKVKESTRARRKCWYPKEEKKCSDVSNWNGWTRCQGPTAACSPSGNGPKWTTEYLIRTNCCLYQSKIPCTQKTCEGNTRRGVKRKKHRQSKVDLNPKDLDLLEELLAEFAGKSSSCQEAIPVPKKSKRQLSKIQDCYVQQKECKVYSPDSVNPHPATNKAEGQSTADLHDDKCHLHSVYIRMWDGQLLKVDITDDSTTKELHEAVETAYGKGLPEEASFYRGALKVKEEVPLKHQGISAESTVQVLLKLKGGGDKGNPEASGEAKVDRHMTEWTEEEATQWMQTVGKMRPDEVKPLIEDQVDGLALWEMSDFTVESLNEYFNSISPSAVIKLRKALKNYKDGQQSFEQVTLPDELPANVTCWGQKEIEFWLSQVVKLAQNDIDSLCKLKLDGDTFLMLDKEAVIFYLPEMKTGPLLKFLFCLEKLNLQQSKQKTEIEDEKGGVDETASDIPDDDVAQSLSDAANDTNKTKATKAFVDLSATKNESKETLVSEDSTTEGNSKAKSAFTDKTDVIKGEVPKAQDEVVPSVKDVEPKTLSLVTSGFQESDKEPIPTLTEQQTSSQELAQVQLAQASSKNVKLTEKEEAILHLLKSSGLDLYEPELTENPQQCEISVIYARPKKKNELDLSFNFLVIRKVSESDPNTSHTKKLWDTIRKKMIHWVEFLPQKSRKEYYVDQKAASSEYVFHCKDKTIISLSKKDPTCIPLGQVDIAVLKSMEAASTILIVEESFKTEGRQEHVTLCIAKDRRYCFQYSRNDNWHASFDEGLLLKGQDLKLDTPKMTKKGNNQLKEKESSTVTESLLEPLQSPKQLSHKKTSKAETDKNEWKPVDPIKNVAKSQEVVYTSAQQDSTTKISSMISNDQRSERRSNMDAYQSDSSVDKRFSNEDARESPMMGNKQVSNMDVRQASDHDIGSQQKSDPVTQPQSPAPITVPSSGHSTPSISGTYEPLGPGKQRPFPFGRSDTGNYSYKRGAVLTVMESGSGNLLSPSHEFKVFQQVKSTDRKINFDARDYFIYETLRFATGCINARSNGTIHFGVGDDVGGKYQHGEIVGIGIQEKLKAKFDDMIKDTIPTCFRQDWAISAVNQCINPVRFIPVQQEHLEPSVRKYVIEVDVVPTFALTQTRAFFIKFRTQMRQSQLLSRKIQPGECLYFRERASTVLLKGPKLDDFQNSLLDKLAQERNMQEKNSTSERPSYNHEYYAKKLEGCLLGGEADLRTRYPILFVSKPDFQSKDSQDVRSELSFITEIPWLAIFDLDPNSDGSGICRLFRSQMEKECSLYQPEEKFFHFSDHEELADAILFPEKTCWIFANGRNALDEKPYGSTQWNGTERCKAVKNAISFFSRPDKIPPGKAVIVFLILSEEIETLVSCFRYCFDDFCGIDNFLCLFENENTYELWENHVQGVCSLDDLQGKSIVGMPWAHINQTVLFINGLKVQSEPLIPTSSGSYVSLTNQQRNKLDDLEVLSKNQCEDLDLDPESDYFEEICQKKELMFYKGNEVDWLNFFFTEVHHKNHVMQRDQFDELHKLVSAALFRREPQSKRKSVIIITLYYQAGSGATTLSKHVLWSFRKSLVRCCVVQRITDDTAKQILDLRSYGEENENECFPVLILIDNKNEELVQNLIAGIERQIRNKEIVTKSPVCIILQCRRTQDAKKHRDGNPTDSEYLEQRVSHKEMRWLEKKQKDLEKNVLEEDLDMSFTVYESDSDNEDADDTTANDKEISDLQSSLNLDKDPQLFIKFMILRKNFDKEFVRNFVANSLKDVKDNEILLLRYTALLNVFAEKEDSYVPLHCAEALMGIDKSKYLTMNIILSPAVKVFLILVQRLTCGFVQGYKFVDSILANEVLTHMVKMQQTYTSIACDFLGSRLFSSDAYSTKDLIFFTKEMLKRRKKFAYGDEIETQFSLLVEHICEKEKYQAAVAVLKKGLDKFGDPMIAQTLARLFTKHKNFAEAHEFAKIAVDLEPDNSYLLVTAGKVYHEEMMKEFAKLDRRINTLSMLKKTISLAMSAVKQYSKSQEANRRAKYALNSHSYLEDIKTCFRFLSMMSKIDPFKGSVGQAKLQRYLTEPEFVPDEVQEVWKEFHTWIKSIKARLDVSIDFLEKDLTYNKQRSRDVEHEWFKKSFYQQVRNYPLFFGMLEKTVITNDEERKRLQACTLLEGHNVNFSRAFDYIRKGKNAVPNLERVMELLRGIEDKKAFDLEGLISVSLALSTVDPHSKKIPSFEQVYDWCVLLSTFNTLQT